MSDTSDTRQLLAEHLKFFGELGATGFRRDAAWARRPGIATPTEERAEGDERRAEGRGQRAEPEAVESTLESTRPTAQSPQPKAEPDLASIREDIGDCTRCKLCSLGRKQVVFGVGNPHADLM